MRFGRFSSPFSFLVIYGLVTVQSGDSPGGAGGQTGTGSGPGGAGSRSGLRQPKGLVCKKDEFCDRANGEDGVNCPDDCCPEGFASCSGFEITTPTPPPTPAPTPFPEPELVYGLQQNCNIDDTSGFNLCLDLVSTEGTFQTWMNAYAEARARWETVIIGNLDSQSSDGIAAQIIENQDPDGICTGLPSMIDDIYICGRDALLENNFIGLAGPTFVRALDTINPFTGTPYIMTLTGIMKFDTAALEDLEFIEGGLVNLILHEMGHVLGLGTFGWLNNGLRNPDANEYLAGTAAEAEWNAIGCSGPLPLDTIFGHWKEECLQDELMTGVMSQRGQQEVLSRITVGSLQDLGFQVDFDAAEPYTMADLGVCGDNCPELSSRRLVKQVAKGEAGPIPKRRMLSQNGLAAVKEFAFKQHSSMRAHVRAMGELPDDIMYVGDENLIILYMEDGEIHRIPITWDDVKHMDEK